MIYPRFEKYRKARTVQFLNDVLDILSQKDAKLLNIENKYIVLQNGILELNSIWKNSRRSKLTAELKELDEKRGAVYRGFKITMETWSRNHYDDDKRHKAKEIMATIQSYHSRLTELPYQEETAGIKSFVKNMKKLYSDQIKALKMMDWIDNLASINSEFEKRYILRTQELSLHNDGEINNVKQNAISYYRALMNLFEARLTIAKEESSPNLGVFFKIEGNLTQLAEQHNLAASRSGRDSQKPSENIEENDYEEEEEVSTEQSSDEKVENDNTEV